MRIALIGLGEVGRVLAEELGEAVSGVWDTAFVDPGSAASVNAAALGLKPAAGAADAVEGAHLVISAVTAANDLAAAEAAAQGIAPGGWFLDLNSASPGQKQASARAIEAVGGRYVESAVMSPIEPKRLAAPMLLGGPHAAAFAELVRPLGFAGLEVYADTIGPASATKLCRSVIIKGVEALVTESMLAARAWGVDQRVRDSLSDLLPVGDWDRLAAYMMSRSLIHGTRRAEEMREAARTVAETGIPALMATATAQRQDWAAPFKAQANEADIVAMVDAVRGKLTHQPTGLEQGGEESA